MPPVKPTLDGSTWLWKPAGNGVNDVFGEPLPLYTWTVGEPSTPVPTANVPGSVGFGPVAVMLTTPLVSKVPVKLPIPLDIGTGLGAKSAWAPVLVIVTDEL